VVGGKTCDLHETEQDHPAHPHEPCGWLAAIAHSASRYLASKEREGRRNTLGGSLDSKGGVGLEWIAPVGPTGQPLYLHIVFRHVQRTFGRNPSAPGGWGGGGRDRACFSRNGTRPHRPSPRALWEVGIRRHPATMYLESNGPEDKGSMMGGRADVGSGIRLGRIAPVHASGRLLLLHANRGAIQ
jgi:hypothetical protein